MNNKTLTLLALAALSTGSLSARGEYDEIARLQAMNERVQGIRSMADGEHYTTLENNDIRRYAYATASEGVSLLPSPAPNLAISDYAFSPDERMILIASGRTPIYRHSYTTQYHLLADGRFFRRPKRRATPPFRPTGGRSPIPTATTSTSGTSLRAKRNASPTTGRGTQSSTARRTGSTRRSSARRAPTPSRPTEGSWPSCASTNRKCR